MNNKVSHPIFNPNKSINIVNGISVKPKLITEENCADKGKAMVGMLIDFKTPLLFTIDSITCIVEVEKNVQKTNPVNA